MFDLALDYDLYFSFVSQFALALTLLAATASTVSGRYLVIDMDDVEFVGENADAPIEVYHSMEEANYAQQVLSRQRRQAQLEEEQPQLIPQQRPQMVEYRPETVSQRRQGVDAGPEGPKP